VVFLGKADKLKSKKMAEKAMMKMKNKKEELMHSVMQIMMMVSRIMD